MMDHLTEMLTLQGLMGLLSLTVLEIILGIDNVVFIALVIQHLPKVKRELARRIGLTLALGLRIMLLLSIAWMLRLTEPLFTVLEHGYSGKDVLLVLGGLFLIYKAVESLREIFTHEEEAHLRKSKSSMVATIVQIMVIDLLFSFDSVITAVGVTKNIPVIITAMSIAMLIMLFFTGFVSDFIAKYPSLKVLAVAFIMLIGVLLIGEGFGFELERGYVYFAMAFSCLTESVNILVQAKKNKSLNKA